MGERSLGASQRYVERKKAGSQGTTGRGKPKEERRAAAGGDKVRRRPSHAETFLGAAASVIALNQHLVPGRRNDRAAPVA